MWTWGSQNTPCWGCPGGLIRAEIGVGWGGPEALCAESALAGKLKLKWFKIRGPGTLHTMGALFLVHLPCLNSFRHLER